VRSNRLRTPQERKILAEEGRKIAVVEAQGPLFFGSTEQLLRRLTQLAADARYIVVDFKRVHLADSAARKLIRRAARSMAGGSAELVFASLARGPARAARARSRRARGAAPRSCIP
jgi:glutaminase